MGIYNTKPLKVKVVQVDPEKVAMKTQANWVMSLLNGLQTGALLQQTKNSPSEQPSLPEVLNYDYGELSSGDQEVSTPHELPSSEEIVCHNDPLFQKALNHIQAGMSLIKIRRFLYTTERLKMRNSKSLGDDQAIELTNRIDRILVEVVEYMRVHEDKTQKEVVVVELIQDVLKSDVDGQSQLRNVEPKDANSSNIIDLDSYGSKNPGGHFEAA